MPCPRNPLACDTSGPPPEGGAREALRGAGVDPAAGGTELTFREALGPAAIALSQEHGCHAALQGNTFHRAVSTA